ncbi:MAG TPA: dienelactone hydrolase family protein [Kineosporiaceae bacterium]|nr:dienelactone hydrolase family protein [Kineosporiaceae bacterium]
MCHDSDSRPPAAPADAVTDPRTVERAGDLRLTSADGTQVAAYEAVPGGEPRARIVVLPDVRGLHPYYRALADLLAEAGLHAVAVDYFGRTAAGLPRDDDFDYPPHVRKVTPEQVGDDVAAAIRHLSPEGTLPVFTVGFCFGGGHSWRLAVEDSALAGAIGFYGRPPLVDEALARSTGRPAPVLMLIAGDDRATPVEESLALADRLRAKGADVEAHVFAGAPHSFFDRAFAEHRHAYQDAWRFLLSFVDRHTATPARDG